MNIADLGAKGKHLAARLPRDILIVAILLLASSASFGLGILEGRTMGQGSAFSISQIPMTATGLGAAAAEAVAPGTSPAPASIPAGGEVVGSKNGTKYFFPWCSGAKLISAANLVTFASAEEAQAKGYTPASNCKGL